MKRFHNIYLAFVGAGLLATASSCSDDFKSPDINSEGFTGITLMIPNTEGATQFAKTRSADAEERGATRAGEEGNIKGKDLWLFAYATNNKEANTVIKQLERDTDPSDISSPYKPVKVTLNPDTYQIYVVANLSPYLSNITLSDGLSQTDLESAILNFSSDKPLSLTTGLPMACKNTEIKVEGNTPVGTDGVNIEAGKNKTIYADLTFLCSKVRYTLLFDRNDFSSAFGSNTFDFTSTDVSNIANQTKWYDPSADYTLYDNTESILSKPKAYPSSKTEFDKLVEDGLQLSDLQGTANPDQMAWQQVLYLPENLSTSDDDKTTLTLNTSIEGQASSYQIILNNGSNKSDKDLKRGRSYDIVAKAVSNDICKITMSKDIEWTPMEILADFTHTYLTLAKTEASVNSLEDFTLAYQTDGAGGVKMECEETLDGKPVVVATPSYDPVSGNVLILSVNSEINLATLPTGSKLDGTAICWVKAGNIKKQILVAYDITPFLTVNPEERTIAYTAAGEKYTEFSFETNLGGIKIKPKDGSDWHTISPANKNFTSTSGDSNLEISIEGDNSSVAEGKIIAKAISAPKTTSTHHFLVEPLQAQQGKTTADYQKEITVIVQPDLKDYRIYFRAINDYFITNGGEEGHTEEFLKELSYRLPAESGNDLWKDFWNGNNASMSNSKHLIYIYNQFGNNKDFGTLSDDVNEFTGWNNTSMIGDDNNIGWYYYDLSKNEFDGYKTDADPTFKENDHYKKPQPGETLIIFHNGESDGGQTAHRVSHAKQAGIPLFSYADCEGWYVYDPTRDPIFVSYDDKPIIENKTYTIYSDKPLKKWYRTYGTWNDNENEQITIHADNWNGGSKNSKEGSYYVNYLDFKVANKEYDKAITLSFEGQSTESYNHYVYFETWPTSNNDDWKNDPYIVFFKADGSGEKKVRMSWVQNLGGHHENNNNNPESKRWKAEVPEGYHNGIIRFVSDNGKQFWPSSTETKSITPQSNYIGYSNSSTFITTSDFGSPTMKGIETVIFDGDIFPNNTGYFNTTTKKWAKGKP